MKLFKKLFGSSSNEVVEAVAVEQNSDELVKQIHDEVDSLEEKSIKAVEQMLAELKIPTIGKIQDKAELMKSLGFSSSNEVVKDFETIKKDIAEKESIQSKNKAKLELINEYRLAYPADKIIPLSEFLKVLEKYNLIYAPAKSYIKDVPEKNLLDIKNAKKINYKHEAVDIYYIESVETKDYYNNQRHLIASLHKYFSEIRYLKYKKIETHYMYVPDNSEEVINLVNRYGIDDNGVLKIGYWSVYSANATVCEYPNSRIPTLYEAMRSSTNYIGDDKNGNGIYLANIKVPTQVSTELKVESHNEYIKRLSKELFDGKYDLSKYINNIRSSRVSRNNLYISAPKNHFDLSNLSGYSDGKGFYEMQKPKLSHIPDPIAFYLLKGIDEGEEFVRIISKWGTSDDQSYLDPIVQDERMN